MLFEIGEQHGKTWLPARVPSPGPGPGRVGPDRRPSRTWPGTCRSVSRPSTSGAARIASTAGGEGGLTTAEKAELADANRRISEFETELAIARRAVDELKEGTDLKAVRGDQADGRRRFPVQVSCQILGLSEAGYYRWLTAPASERAVRHAWLTDLICRVHIDSRGTYGSRRVHAELTLGHELAVGHQQVSC